MFHSWSLSLSFCPSQPDSKVFSLPQNSHCRHFYAGRILPQTILFFIFIPHALANNRHLVFTVFMAACSLLLFTCEAIHDCTFAFWRGPGRFGTVFLPSKDAIRRDRDTENDSGLVKILFDVPSRYQVVFDNHLITTPCFEHNKPDKPRKIVINKQKNVLMDVRNPLLIA